MSRHWECERGRFASKVVLGAGLMALGVALMLHNLGIVDGDYTLRFWPCLLIAFGLSKLWSRGLLAPGGHALILAGGFLQVSFLRKEGWLALKWWPVALVYLGALLVLKALLRARPCCEDRPFGRNGEDRP